MNGVVRRRSPGASTPLDGPLRLGLDAGGSYTDAVLLGPAGAVVAWAKAPTTPRAPAHGIAEALAGLPPRLLPRVRLAGLATTFATNALVEGRGSPAGLILIGYDPPLPRLPGSPPLLAVAGGHDYWGEERCPLDRAALSRGLAALLPGLRAVAVASFFSVRNPEHELAAARLVRKASGLPVVCGHRLSSRLDVIRRATTAWWNARLIPLLTALIDATEGVLAASGVGAPLMVVRGDGTLMSAATARGRPVETLLSGPAASALGAKHLSGAADGLVVDMGGTTTDLALLQDGRVALDPQGARVGPWQTHVEAARMRTLGLGGDSLISWADGRAQVGPRRVEPLCLAAAREPRALDLLREALGRPLSSRRGNPSALWFPADGVDSLPPGFPAVALSEALLLEDPAHSLSLSELDSLERDGRSVRCALTPTDLLVAAGRLALGTCEASRLGTALWARRAGVSEAAFATAVEEETCRRLCTEAVAFADPEHGPALAELWPAWFSRTPGPHRAVRAQVYMETPVLGGGAPSGAFLPAAFVRLGTHCVLSEASAVSTAVGAVVGAVEITLRAEAHPTASGSCILYLPGKRQTHPDMAQALTAGRSALEALAGERLLREGITHPVLRFTAEEKAAPLGAGGGQFLIRTELTVAASGRMDLGRGTKGSERKET